MTPKSIIYLKELFWERKGKKIFISIENILLFIKTSIVPIIHFQALSGELLSLQKQGTQVLAPSQKVI